MVLGLGDGDSVFAGGCAWRGRVFSIPAFAVPEAPAATPFSPRPVTLKNVSRYSQVSPVEVPRLRCSALRQWLAHKGQFSKSVLK